jgi:anthranilate phosphoribosyltransferase
MSELILQTKAQFSAGQDLDGTLAESLLDEMIGTSDESLLADLFNAWNQKGISADEIYTISKVLRERCIKINSRFVTFVDIVGTGGSSAKTFNVSTAAAFVVAGAGVPVAKHGNRAATSSSGSADVLAELGVRFDIDPIVAEQCLNELGICFMFAPNHHRLSATLARVRRNLGFPTIFNCVGPLCNPASAPHQVIGVWNQELVSRVAGALAQLGTSRSWIVNGHDKLDEISMTGGTTVSDVSDKSISTFEVTARDVGIDSFDGDLPSGCSVKESGEVIRMILSNRMRDRDPEKLVLLNAAAAIYVAGKEKSLASAYLAALESIRSGSAEQKLAELSQITNG